MVFNLHPILVYTFSVSPGHGKIDVCVEITVPGEKLVAEHRHVQQYQNILSARQMLFAELILTVGVFYIPGCGTTGEAALKRFHLSPAHLSSKYKQVHMSSAESLV